MKKTLLVCLNFFFVLFSVQAQYNVKYVKAGDNGPAAAIRYCLPQNTFSIEVTVEQTFFERGIYSDYSEQLLKMPAIHQNRTLYQIKDIKIHSRTLADPDYTFVLEGNDLPDVCLSPEGILLGVNMGEKPEPREMHRRDGMRRFEEGPKPEGERLEEGGMKKMPTDRHPGEAGLARQGFRKSFVPVTELNAGRKFDTIVTQKANDSQVIIEKLLRPRIDEKNLFEQARKMADQVLKIRKTQSDLLAGIQEVPYPDGTLKFMCEQLERNEQEILDCFTGTLRRETKRYTFEVVPQEGVSEYPVAYFSKDEGLDDIDTAGGSVQDILMLQLQTLPSVQGLSLKELQKAQKNASNASTEPKKSAKNQPEEPQNGFVCRIPMPAKAKISLNGQVLEQKNIFVSQWGGLQQLPALKDYSLEFNGKTGALKNMRKR